MISQNLLKLVDYPFISSIISVSILFSGAHLGLERASISSYAPLLLVLGLTGTILAITDPIGRVIRYVLKHFAEGFGYNLPKDLSASLQREIDTLKSEDARMLAFHNRNSPAPQDASQVPKYLKEIFDASDAKRKELQYKISNAAKHHVQFLMKTKWVLLEVDRIVAIIYFVIVLGVISASLLSPLSYNLSTSITRLGEETALCTDADCSNLLWIMGVLTVSVPLVTIGVAIVLFRELKELLSKAKVVSDYLRLAESGRTEIEEWLQRMGTSLDNGDWGRAGLLGSYMRIAMRDSI